MRKLKILPKLAMTGVMKNGSIYFPYMGAGVFSVFIWFVFSSILHNDIVDTLPKSAYAMVLLMIGKVLLALIILPFLFYTNSFLIKRRKKEIGLYSVLGLEKRHIGVMVLLETMLVYAVAVAGGILIGVVFSKLLFLLLLNMTGLPVDAEFQYSRAAFLETILYFAAAYGLNLLANLWQISRSRPVELLSGAKKGEKEPKHLWIPALLGTAALLAGYFISITSKMDGFIFSNFFLAVFLVIVGTYFLFTAGSIVVLKQIRKRKKLYYKPEHFITVSGMLYRMKKSAASLVNICIFATMVIITMSCTLALFLGNEGILEFDYPYDAVAEFAMHQVEREEIVKELEQASEEHNVTLEDTAFFPNYMLQYDRSGSRLLKSENGQEVHVGWLALDTYNDLMGLQEQLAENEAFVFSTGPEWEEDTVVLDERTFRVKGRPQDMKLIGKAEGNTYQKEYYIVVKDEAVVEECVEGWKEMHEVEQVLGSDEVYLLIQGEETDRQAFLQSFAQWCNETGALRRFENSMEQRDMTTSMNGGLLFIGIIFGTAFLLCMILIMYYKQIAEGYEDRSSFEIMQKVGMSDVEIKRTIRKQILFVFGLPLIGAVCHSIAGMPLVNELFGAIRLYDRKLVMESGLIITLVIMVLYGISYRFTANAYYRIVKR